MSERRGSSRTEVRRAPPAPAGLGPRPRLPKQTGNAATQESARSYEPVEEDAYETAVGPDRPWRSLALMGVAIAGIGVSIYVTVLHYAHVNPVCSDNGAINCLKVLTSPQSVFLGIPVPVYGLVFFVAMFAVCLPRFWHTSIWWIPWVRLGMSIVGIAFALRLIYEELFVIRSLCLWCTGAHVLSFAMFVIIVTGWEDATSNVIPRNAA